MKYGVRCVGKWKCGCGEVKSLDTRATAEDWSDQMPWWYVVRVENGEWVFPPVDLMYHEDYPRSIRYDRWRWE